MINVAENVPVEVLNDAIKVFERSRDGGKLKIGTNEVTKAIERGTAKLVLIAADVNPPEIVAHLPGLCAEKNIPCIKGSSKTELGKAAGIEKSAASIALIEAGAAKDDLVKVVEKLSVHAKPKAEKK